MAALFNDGVHRINSVRWQNQPGNVDIGRRRAKRAAESIAFGAIGDLAKTVYAAATG